MNKATKKKMNAPSEMYRSKLKIKTNQTTEETNDSSPPLKKFSLRGNQLCGSILIGNYNYLTQLEVSENEMEVLDLSSLAQLETLKCSRNKLMELMINGRNLTSIVAAWNSLHTISIVPSPGKLTHLDISHNYFTELPRWIAGCNTLEVLNASHNQLQTLNEFFASYDINALRHLNIAYNNVQTLSTLPERFASVEELRAQSNELQCLPSNFFHVLHKRLKLLNLACNKLATLGNASDTNAGEAHYQLEELMLSSNCLNEHMFKLLVQAKKLRVLHAAYNKISELPEACIRSWTQLEVLVLSGNMLQDLPDNITLLARIEVLRVHSNLLLSTPTLAKLSNLKVLDLAHNHLDHVNLLSIVPKQLKHLDLSCNLQLQVDEQQMRVCQKQRNWSLVDVSGKNRLCLPTAKLNDCKDNNVLKPPWTLGFSETTGKCRRLLVSQLRLSSFRADEALFGMFESSGTSVAAATLAKLVPKILQQERTVKETLNEYMKYTLLAAQQKLLLHAGGGDCHAVGATLCHIAREHLRFKDFVRPQKTKKYVLRVASVGNIAAYLVRRTANVCLTSATTQYEPYQTEKQPAQLAFPDPDIAEVTLSNEDEYLVICNGNTWSALDIDRVAREIRKEENVVLAAKRIQDIAQSFGADQNLSAIVVRFRNIGTDVDHLIKELKNTVRKKPHTPTSNCCEQPNSCRNALSFMSRQLTTGAAATSRSDRSSPSGQSDQALNPLTKDGDGDEFILAHAHVLEEEDEMEMLEENESVLSEEQFKCWEYMLEQNTQLLFDKELNTISKSFTKNRNNERKLNRTPERLDYKTNLLKTFNSKFISASSPQLLYSEVKKPPPAPTQAAIPQQHQHQHPHQHHHHLQQQQTQQQVSFLSKRFGSSRSFQTASGYNLFEPKSRDSLNIDAYTKLGGGPNAAYFGSLQRLMPYNLEYDFAVMQERSALDDDDEYSEHESRMRKYWGVATTEL